MKCTDFSFLTIGLVLASWSLAAPPLTAEENRPATGQIRFTAPAESIDALKFSGIHINGESVIIDADIQSGRELNAPGGLRLSGHISAELSDISLSNNQSMINSATANEMSVSGTAAHLSGFKKLTLNGGRITGNLASTQKGSHAHGGGLAVESVGLASITGMEFDGNTARVEGTGQSGSISGHVTSAAARGGALSLYNQGEAGAVFLPSSLMEINLEDTIFSGNIAEAMAENTEALGGAMAVMGNISARINGAGLAVPMFSGNRAAAGPDSSGGAEGGAVVIMGNPWMRQREESRPSAVFADVTFESNTAESKAAAVTSMDVRGGAVSSSTLDGRVIFRNSLFVKNQTKSTVASSAKGRGRARGGAVFSSGGLVIENSVFRENSGQSTGAALGGALEVSGKSVIKNSRFESNTAKSGSKPLDNYNGPVAAMGGAIYLGGQATVAGSEFKDNSAYGLTAKGGAIYVNHRGALKLLDASFINNGAYGPDALGGAVYVEGGGKVAISVTKGRTVYFSGNMAGVSPEKAVPSGIFFDESDSNRPSPSAPGEKKDKPEPDDLLIDVSYDAELIMADPIHGPKAKIAKSGSGTLMMSGPHLADEIKITEGSLRLAADAQGRGASLTGKRLSFAENSDLKLRIAPVGPHIIEVTTLELPPDLEITAEAANETGEAVKEHVILKLSGGADIKITDKHYAGTIRTSRGLRNYRLEWNERDELTYIPLELR